MYKGFRKVALAAALVVAAGTAAAQGETAWQQSITRYIESQISNGPLKGAVVGVCAVENGKTVVAYNASTRMVPASNMKLVTTGAALRAFGPEYRFKTEIGYTGSIDKDGTLNGDVYIIGGGDPTIGAADTTAFKADALFWKWKTILSSAGIKRINGNIIGDGSAWEGGLEHPGWEYADTWTYYGTGSSALCFYENTIDLQVSAGAEPGAPVNMTQTYPDTPWLHLENQRVVMLLLFHHRLAHPRQSISQMVDGLTDRLCLHLHQVDVFRITGLGFKIQFAQCRTTTESQLRGKELVAEDAYQRTTDNEVLLHHIWFCPRSLLFPFLDKIFWYHISSVSIFWLTITFHLLSMTISSIWGFACFRRIFLNSFSCFCANISRRSANSCSSIKSSR